MKTYWKKLIIVPLLVAVTVAPMCAQDNDDTAKTPDAPPAPPAPSALAHTNNETISTLGQTKRKVEDESTPVRIDGTGIHVGGKDPVDINIPGLGGKGPARFINGLPQYGPHFGADGLPVGAVFLGALAIIMPFVFLIAIIGGNIYFKFRRNRMLHETIRLMIDKGVPIPPELIMLPTPQVKQRANRDLRNGLVWLGVGLGLVAFHERFGWIPAFVGLAFLATWFIEKKQNAKDTHPIQ